MVSKRGNLAVRLMIFDGIDEKQLTSTPDAAIGTTRRGTLLPGLYEKSFFSTSATLLQAFPNLNSGDNLGHRRACGGIWITRSNARHRHWSMLSDKQSCKR